MLTQGIFRVEHDPADTGAARDVLRYAEAALREFAPHLKAGNDPIHFVIAHEYGDFAAFSKVFGKGRVSGMARSEQGLIILKSPRLRYAGEDFRGTVRHELVHVLLARTVNTDNLPHWLNEGIAMSLANEHHWDSIFHIARMFVTGRVIEYKDLDMRLRAPGDEMEFNDAYAQSLSMTRFLRKRLGEDLFWQVVMATRDTPFGEALRERTALTVLDFWNAYHRSLWLVALIGMLGSGSVFALPACLVIIAYFRKRFTNRRILRQWEQEEADEPLILSWDDVSEGPYEWEHGGDEDEPPTRR